MLNIVYPGVPLPSTDFYIKPFLNYKKQSFKYWSPNFSLNKFYSNEKFNLIVVRYLSDELVQFVKKNRKLINKFVYFMDDDLWDIKVLRFIPYKYAFKVFKHAYRYKKFLIKEGALLWVSNNYLAEKYNKYNPQILYPYPFYKNFPQEINWKDDSPIFYHATSSHNKEFFWLKELIKFIPERLFEIILEKKFLKHFKNLSNCYSIYPLPWEVYKNFIGFQYRNIGLAFQFDNPFNRARNYVKFFNIVKAGAIGIYSESFPEAQLIKKFEAGVVVPLEFDKFKEAILSLDEISGKYYYANSLKLLEFFRTRAEISYKVIDF